MVIYWLDLVGIEAALEMFHMSGLMMGLVGDSSDYAHMEIPVLREGPSFIVSADAMQEMEETQDCSMFKVVFMRFEKDLILCFPVGTDTESAEASPVQMVYNIRQHVTPLLSILETMRKVSTLCGNELKPILEIMC